MFSKTVKTYRKTVNTPIKQRTIISPPPYNVLRVCGTTQRAISVNFVKIYIHSMKGGTIGFSSEVLIVDQQVNISCFKTLFQMIQSAVFICHRILI